ncbi:MAG: extracellular solute-binding protein [Anaerolineae bacterium]|nr:extracellular solute-binding protein [Anaerolineae bacterium]
MLLVWLVSACQGAGVQPTPQTITPTTAVLRPMLTSLPVITPTATLVPLPPVDTKTLNGVVVKFWHPWGGEEEQVLRAIVEDFNTHNIWGIHVEASAVGGSSALFDLLIENINSGSLPHVVAAPTNQLADQRIKTVLVDLNPYVADVQWGLSSQEVAGYAGVIWQQDISEGKRLGVPAQRDVQALFYNRSWARELGFNTPPETPLAFKAQVCAAARQLATDQDAANDGTGGWIVSTDPLVMLSWMLAFGEVYFPAAEEEDFTFDTPDTRQAYAFLKSMYDDGCAWISRLPQPYQYFANRQALVYSGTLADIAPQSRASTASGSQDEWEVITYPLQGTQRKPIALTSGLSYAMLKTDPAEQLASWLFVRWMLLPRHIAGLIEVDGTLPVNHAALEYLEDYRQKYPQWDRAMMLPPLARAAPATASWRVVRGIVQDSARQIYQPTLKADQAEMIPLQLDQMIKEVLQHQTVGQKTTQQSP